MAADGCGEVLKKKLTDLAMISDAYDALLENIGTDPSDRLTLLASQIPESTFLTEKSVVYVDGFTDFTAAELAVLKAIMVRGADLTVCLTTEGLHSRNEIFSLPGSSGGKLLEAAAELGIETKEEHSEENPEEGQNPIRIFADQLFSFTERSFFLLPNGSTIPVTGLQFFAVRICMPSVRSLRLKFWNLSGMRAAAGEISP